MTTNTTTKQAWTIIQRTDGSITYKGPFSSAQLADIETKAWRETFPAYRAETAIESEQLLDDVATWQYETRDGNRWRPTNFDPFDVNDDPQED